ncbi:PAS domain S-box protein [Kamptonema sp. UHCC 0994]|uniref:PAS domain S-box protein n=1 Tax=Kamptonema sp. UHCC 0994 TaxID=3031329 RepID=UPI0023B942D7|nr:PAS domain S-box protein [Kamptonema sp. UHCC 0994]MDF0555476.1 PAS domain S-box protein [Kamptonema sp. UHCC 0994]
MKFSISHFLKILWLDRPTRQRGTIILAIPVTCLFASVIAISWVRDRTINTRSQIDKGNQILKQTDHLLKTVVDAETGMRGYGLTKRPDFIEPYLKAKANLPQLLKQLKVMVQENPAQLQRFEEIKKSTQQEIIFLENTLKNFDSLGKEREQSPQLTNILLKGKLQMDTLRQQINNFVVIQKELQAVIEDERRHWVDLTNFVQIGALFVGLLGGGASWYLFDRLDRELTNREASLQESKTRIQAVVDNAADGILTLDEQGNIESFNLAAERIFGSEAREVLGLNLRKLIAKPAREDSTGNYLKNFLTNSTAKLNICQQEIEGIYKNGATFPMELAVSEMRLASGRLFIGICRDITERKQSEKTLRKQSQLLDLANDSITVLDLNDEIADWNQGARRLYGWRKSETIGKNIHTLLQTEFPEPLPKIKAAFLRDGSWEGELVHTKQDGSKLTVASRWTLQRDEDGIPLASLQINNDISDRKMAEFALRDSKQMLQLVMDNIPQFIYWKDRNFIYRGCNQNFARILGLKSPTDIIGLTDYDLPIPEEQAERYRAISRDILETNIPQYHLLETFTSALPNSSTMLVDVSKVPLTDGEDRAIGILCSFEDITDRKKAEVAIAESEQRFRATFEQAAVGIAQTNLEGKLLLVNQKLCEILGYSREELLGNKFHNVSHPEDLKVELEYISQLLAGEFEIYSMEKRFIRKNGELIWGNLTVSLLREQDGSEYLMGVVEDIRERKEAQEALRKRAQELAKTTRMLSQTATVLRKRNQELDQFAYVVSHDLKAPLRAIANLSSWIEEDLSEAMTEDTQHQMNLLRGRVHRMEALIDALLQYSRVGRIQTASESVNVASLLAEIIDSIAPPKTFTVEVELGMPTLTTERVLLQQVFANLISNAVKHHSSKSGCVKISVNDKEDFYEFAVADNGPGIAPQYHDKVFVIFQTLEARDKVENTGIGLSLVKKIVENQGGTIKLESSEGQGATFCFTWPKQPIRKDEE